MCHPGLPPDDLFDSGTILSEGEGCAAPDEDVYGRFRSSLRGRPPGSATLEKAAVNPTLNLGTEALHCTEYLGH